MDNHRIAAALWEWADVLDIEGVKGYRSRAYRRAADVVATLPEPVEDMLARGEDLTQLKGIGDKMEHRIKQLVEGTWEELDDARKRHDLAGSMEATMAVMDRLHGDLHVHTKATDGRATIQEMAEAAKQRGYEYVAITDHSKDTSIAGGLDEAKMRKHLEAIRRVDDKVDGITVLAGSEVDILKDGSLDFPDDLLKDMDVTVCSIHYRHKLSGAEQTQRILAGMSNDHAMILGHPTARRKGIRPGMEIDLDRIIDAAKQQGWAMEMNGAPERLDLDAAAAAKASEAGVAVSLDSDAHSVAEFGNIRNACRQAVQAGIGPDDVLNALPLDALKRRLR